VIRRPALRPAAAIPLCALAAACAVSPATGKRQTMLISERTEFEIGRAANDKILKDEGAYTAQPMLRAYVESIGQNLAAASARPGIAWHFEITDQTEVNAFALPGGFVYITRGILERMNSEDELAAVLGHEIAHVAARHGASQISKAYIAQVGLVATTILAGPTAGPVAGDLANIAVYAAMQGYSRDAEREADSLGFEYAAHAGYNRKGAVDLLQTLARLDSHDPTKTEAFFASHPATAERIRTARKDIEETRQTDPDSLAIPRKRDEYLRQIDGLAVGASKGTTVLSGRTAYDRRTLLAVDIPEGMTAQPGGGETVLVLGARDGIQAALRVVALPKTTSVSDLEAEFMTRNRGLKRSSRDERIGPLGPVIEATYSGRGQDGNPLTLRRTVASRGGNEISVAVLGPGTAGEASQHAAKAFETLSKSLRPITPQEAAAVEAPRLKVQQAAAGDTWASLAGHPALAAALAAYNGFDASDPVPEGDLVKIPPSLSLEP